MRSDYFGGDGPHYSPPYPNPLHRNSSLGVASLRPDGFVGLAPKSDRPLYQSSNGTKSDRPLYQSSNGTATTLPLLVSGRKLLITADTAPSGDVTVVANGAGLPGGAVTCGTVSGRNVTDEVMAACDLGPVVGQRVTLDLSVRDAVVYMVGFAKG